jgi:hypothetical protein
VLAGWRCRSSAGPGLLQGVRHGLSRSALSAPLVARMVRLQRRQWLAQAARNRQLGHGRVQRVGMGPRWQSRGPYQLGLEQAQRLHKPCQQGDVPQRRAAGRTL